MPTLAHAGQPVTPHDLWTSWNLDPVLVIGLIGLVWLHRRGRRSDTRRRDRAFELGIATTAIALVSPLEPLAGALASAHMVQHLLLVLVAAPLLAWSAPGAALLRGAPVTWRRLPARLRRLAPVPGVRLRLPTQPVAVWLLYTGVLWFWHTRWAYEAALASTPVHALEHVTFLGSALLLWRVVVGPRTATAPGVSVLVLFGTGMQSVLLAFLLTFATHPWYASYATTTSAWGLSPLADQQLAGAIMWVPAGLVHVLVALVVLVGWLRATEAGAGH